MLTAVRLSRRCYSEIRYSVARYTRVTKFCNTGYTVIMYVVKADGTREVFKRDKLLSSLRTAGAKEKTAEAVIAHVERELVDGIHTADIYRHAFDVLHKLERPAAARYSLKRALIALGPAGFAFEKFVAEIFKAKGFKTALDVFAQGKCASHELDVVAWNDMSLILVEAKFHNELGMKSDTKVALYVKARFEDLRDASLMYGDHRKMTEGWLIPNSKLNENATRCCECPGVRVIGWNYPP